MGEFYTELLVKRKSGAKELFVKVSLIALILLVPWRCIAIRKTSAIAVEEYKTAKYMWIVFCVCSLLGGFLIMRFTNLLYLLIMTGILAFFIWIFSVWPMERRVNEENN